ncbi:MAG TPA: helix-turn-helix domain-containing protein, partial [Paralcaligenes sp.]
MARQTKQSSAAELNTAQPSITASETTPSQSGSLTKGLAILEVLATSDKPLGVTDIALIMDTAKSGVHRLLQTLRSTGWVSKTPEGRYECTLRL